MPLHPKNITEERLMGLCSAIQDLMDVQAYILGRLPVLTNNDSHQHHLDLGDAQCRLRKANDTLHVYFLGD